MVLIRYRLIFADWRSKNFLLLASFIMDTVRYGDFLSFRLWKTSTTEGMMVQLDWISVLVSPIVL